MENRNLDRGPVGVPVVGLGKVWTPSAEVGAAGSTPDMQADTQRKPDV
jgi:hypothetical protein